MELQELICIKNEYDSYCQRLKEIENSFDSFRAKSEQENKAKFDLLKADVKDTLSKIIPVMKNLCVLCDGQLSFESGAVLYQGRIPSHAAYDENNCVEVYMGAKKALIQTANLIISKRANVLVAAKAVAEFYCTILEIGRNVDAMRTKKVQADVAGMESELKDVRGKIAGIENKYGDLDRAIIGTLKEAREEEARVLLRNDFPVCSEFVSKIHIPVGAHYSQLSGENVFTSCINWELEKDSVFCVKADNYTIESEQIIQLMQNVVLRFLCSYPDIAKNILICNGSTVSNRHLISFCDLLNKTKDNESVFFNRDSSNKVEPGISDAILDTLSDEINNRFRLLHVDSDILGYNAKHQDNLQPLTLVVLYGCSQRDYSKRNLENIFRQGRAAGIYTLIIENKDDLNIKRYHDERVVRIEEFTDNVYDFSIDNSRGVIANGDVKYNTDLVDSGFYMPSLVERILQTLGMGAKRIIPLQNLIELPASAKKDFSKCIDIPIGKSGENTITLSIDVFGNSHVVFAGVTGSGKSSLLCNIILGAAYNYSPDEVEFWLLDFKHGTTFSLFESLKHVKMMALNNKAEDIDEIIDYMLAEKDRRGKLIQKSQKNDIVGYNAMQRQEGKPLMPRLMICIDEYTAMKTKTGGAKLVEIAKQGRSFGMHLIMCSQNEGDFKEVTGQATLRFEFANRRYDLIRFDNIKGVREYNENYFLHLQKGNCLFTSTGTDLTRMRVAYAGEDSKQIDLIKQINARYPDSPDSAPIVMDKVDRVFYNIANPPAQWSKEAIQEQYSKNLEEKQPALYVPIGKTRLNAEKSYLIDRKNPILFLFGDERRAANIELSIALYASQLAKKRPNVYYVDLGLSGRATNCMQAYYKSGVANIEFGNATNLDSILRKVYSIYMDRKQASAEGMAITVPIMLNIHCAERLSAALESSRESEDKLSKVNSLSENEVDAVLAKKFNLGGSQPIDQPQDKFANIPLKKIFRELYEGAKDYLIYMTLQFDFDDVYEFNDCFVNKVVGSFNPKNVVIIPAIPKTETVSTQRLNKYLLAARQHDYVNHTQSSMERHEFVFASAIEEGKLTKCIPYEWEEK